LDRAVISEGGIARKLKVIKEGVSKEEDDFLKLSESKGLKTI
jgi:hypothetical protein